MAVRCSCRRFGFRLLLMLIGCILFVNLSVVFVSIEDFNSNLLWNYDDSYKIGGDWIRSGRSASEDDFGVERSHEDLNLSGYLIGDKDKKPIYDENNTFTSGNLRWARGEPNSSNSQNRYRLNRHETSEPFYNCEGDNLAEHHLPLAPGVFHPKVANWTQSPKFCSPDSRWNQTCCRTVYFWGSGKCGSTTLAMLLKHNPDDGYKTYDPNSGFADGGKEPCWAQMKKMLGQSVLYNKFPLCKMPGLTRCHSAEQQIILDGCPRYSEPMEAGKIYCTDPDAKFVMMIRDPIATTISAHNDNYIIRGKKIKTT